MDQVKIGKFLSELRIQKKLTQDTLGQKLGVTNKTISRWENGNYMPNLDLIPALCSELGISINEFFCGTRLNETDFHKMADKNILLSLKEFQHLRHTKHFYDFFNGAGIGILCSSLYCPDTTRKIIIIAFGLLLIFTSWILQYKIKHSFYNNLDYPIDSFNENDKL